MRISVGNLKLPDFQSRKPETSGENRAAITRAPSFFLVCRYARSPGLAARQSTPAFDAAIYYPNSTSYQLQSSFHTCPTEPEPTARARRAGPAEGGWANLTTRVFYSKLLLHRSVKDTRCMCSELIFPYIPYLLTYPSGSSPALSRRRKNTGVNLSARCISRHVPGADVSLYPVSSYLSKWIQPGAK